MSKFMRWMFSVGASLQLLAACGAVHGPEATSNVTPSALTATPLTITTALSLSPSPVSLGTTATASVTYTNRTRSSISVQGIFITSRPPGGTQAGGPFDTFSPSLGAMTLAPGASRTLTATRAFASTEPTGTWYAYATYQDSSGGWQNGPLVNFEVTASSSPAPSASSPWSIAFYPGWVQTNLPPSGLDYGAFTHVYHFGMYPDDSGHVQLADMQSTSFPPAAIAAAHAAGRKIVLVIGGEGQGTHFVNSTSSSNVSTFVQSIVSTMEQYGYDGVDIDWEESFTPSQFIPLMKQLSAALSQLSPRPTLSVEVDVSQVPPATIGQVASLVDTVDCMCYWDNGLSSFSAYTQAGVPASKFILGMGWSAGYADATPSAVQAKVQEAQANGMRGVDGWQVGDLSGPTTDPRLAPLRTYVASGTGSTPPSPPSPTVPGAPTGVTATAGNAQATVGWAPPSNNGGSALTGYVVTASPGGATATTTGATQATVTGLTNATSYTFTVKATNSVGPSAPSAASSPVTPSAPTGGTVLVGFNGAPASALTDSVQPLEALAVPYTASAAGTLTRLAFKPTTTTATRMALAIYADGSPVGGLLGTCTVAAVTQNAWNNCTLSTGIAITAGARYWLAMVADQVVNFIEDGSTGTMYNNDNNASVAFGSTFATGSLQGPYANQNAQFYGSN